jgi:hypothetical protein
MHRLTNTMLVTVAIMALGLFAGCSEDETPTTPDTQTYDLNMIDLEALVDQVAPPEFVAPSGAPNEIDSVWLYGDYPMLGKVFGSTDPQTLYANIDAFKMFMGMIAGMVPADVNNNLITGVYVDSVMVDMNGDSIMMHCTATVTALSDSTVIPAEAQEVIGTAVNLDYLVSIVVDEMPNGVVNIGVIINDTEQTLLLYDENMGDPTDTQSRLLYASLNPVDSTFVFKGIGYVLHADNEQFSYVFDITSEANSDFSYRMSWYSNGSLEFDILNCILGGGNKDTEFALSYRMYAPADTTVADSVSMYDQVFGPDYSDGTGLITDYSSYVDEGLQFTYGVIPQAMMTNPWAE